jgi:hypothetical protein
MTFGFPAYYSDECIVRKTGVNLENAVADVLRELKWELSEDSTHGMTARIGGGLRTWGEVVNIEFVSGNTVRITSKCVMPTQCLDWGKNKSNVSKFIAALKTRV